MVKPVSNKVTVDEQTTPIKNEYVTVREEVEEDGRFILFNADNELILAINKTGRHILENCDGTNNIAQIIEKLKNDFVIEEKHAGSVSKIVMDFVTTLMEADLVKCVS